MGRCFLALGLLCQPPIDLLADVVLPSEADKAPNIPSMLLWLAPVACHADMLSRPALPPESNGEPVPRRISEGEELTLAVCGILLAVGLASFGLWMIWRQPVSKPTTTPITAGESP